MGDGWSPEQISNRLRVEFPDDESMRISHEAIYQALYIQGGSAAPGARNRELGPGTSRRAMSPQTW